MFHRPYSVFAIGPSGWRVESGALRAQATATSERQARAATSRARGFIGT